MTKRDKRIAQMRANPKKVRFEILEVVLRSYGFVSRQRGTSHIIFAHPELDHILPVAKPHGARQYVDPAAIEQCLEALDLLKSTEQQEE